MNVVLEIDKKIYTLSKVIDFVTSGEYSSHVHSDEEEESLVLPSIERSTAKTDCDIDSISHDEIEGLSHQISRHLLTAPCSTNPVKQNLDESDQINDGESFEQPSKRKKQNRKERNRKMLILTVLMIWLIQMNYQRNYPINYEIYLWCVLEYLKWWFFGYDYYPYQHRFQPTQGTTSTSYQWRDQDCYQHFAIVCLAIAEYLTLSFTGLCHLTLIDNFKVTFKTPFLRDL